MVSGEGKYGASVSCIYVEGFRNFHFLIGSHTFFIINRKNLKFQVEEY